MVLLASLLLSAVWMADSKPPTELTSKVAGTIRDSNSSKRGRMDFRCGRLRRLDDITGSP
jgi:hypothetical protein